jgi:hypothetical protein
VHNGNDHQPASGLVEPAMPLVDKVTKKMDSGFSASIAVGHHPELHTISYTTLFVSAPDSPR